MAIDLYASCPCGSGKKLKWCCQEIYDDIERAFEQLQAGQAESAVATIAKVVASHPENAEAWGRQAQIMSLTGKPEEAEKALDEAFRLNPAYPYGFLLRGMMRQNEGEPIGALMLFRKAAEAYAPDASEQLAVVYEMIGDIEMRLNKPVAARAAVARAVEYQKGNAEFYKAFDQLFNKPGRLPAAARKEYSFRIPADSGAEWQSAVAEASTGRMADAVRALQGWADRHPKDPASLFNLGLVRAWIGDNGPAVEALRQSADLDPDASRAAETWALAEVLRSGHGMEAEADYVEHRAGFQVREPEAMVTFLQGWQEARRLIGLRSNQEMGMLTAIVLDELPSIVVTGASAPPARLAAYMMIAGPLLQFWHPNVDSLERIVADVTKKIGSALGTPTRSIGPIQFGDVVADALLFPTAETTQLDAESKIRTNAQKYFEETWIHKPLRGLNNLSPEQAAKDPILSKRLRGTVQFLEDCAAAGPIQLYDFNRLREKLGLGAVAVAASASTSPVSAHLDFSAMEAGQLAALDPATLTDADLDQAFRAAQRAGADEVTERFAKALVQRPGQGDRYPLFAFLANRYQAAGDLGSAIAMIDDGLFADRDGNSGQRAVDFEVLRGKLLARNKDAAGAKSAFEHLLKTFPKDMKAAGAAAEAMLGLKQPAHAKQFAEHGLAQAREQGSREMEGYFLELLAAANR